MLSAYACKAAATHGCKRMLEAPQKKLSVLEM
jgi:hypothetical protein